MIRAFKTVLSLALLAGLSITAVAQEKPAAPAAPPENPNFPPRMQSFPLYGEAAVPNSKPGPDEETTGGFVRNVSRPMIQVYRPARSKATGAAVLIFPGGSYHGLSFEYEGIQQANYFVDHGIAAFVVKYRIPNDKIMVDKSMGPLQDAQQAMRYARQHAAELNIDAHRIGVVGFSAGGHLASTLATHYAKAYVDNPDNMDLRPDFLVLVYPVISMDAKITHADSRQALLGEKPTDAQVRFFSNELHATKDSPPTLILHAADDRLVDVDNSIAFLQALRRAGAPVEARLFTKGEHGFYLLPRDRWQGAIMDWIMVNGWLSPRAR